MAEVEGFCDERFRPLEDAFRANLDSGLDKGASLAVTLGGEFVVDLWGGTRDYELSQSWETDTVVRVFSTSKVMVMITTLMLVDRGLLDLDAPIAQYWPEFAKQGKEAITARQVLVHRSGLPGFGRSVTFDDVADWDRVVSIIEDAPLWYEPGTIACYHPHTFGFLLGELVRRLGGVAFEEYFRREIAEPLGADFHFGLSTDEAARVAALWPAEQEPIIDSPMGAAVMGEFESLDEWIDPQFLPIVLPAGSGITNARALARIGSVVAMNGELDGRRYLSRATIDQAATEQSYAEDEVLGWARYGLGFGLDSPEFPAPTPSTIHWGGYGGSFLTMDPHSGISCGFAQNQLMIGEAWGDDPRLTGFWRLLGEITRDLS
ncbi:MAG TPA: serine hydrolase domain-containing protein [Ilumatobacteraceae bacterium]|nr:serine hydrolase domain-containing protein [Ilumatobacteraceae bacterium]